jgi:hypothetical protein
LRNPWVRLRLLRWGWNVLFTTGTSEADGAREQSPHVYGRIQIAPPPRLCQLPRHPTGQHVGGRSDQLHGQPASERRHEAGGWPQASRPKTMPATVIASGRQVFDGSPSGLCGPSGDASPVLVEIQGVRRGAIAASRI